MKSKQNLSNASETIEVNITKKNVKNYNLRINRDAKVFLSVPMHATPASIENFLSDKRAWIFNNYHKQLKRLEKRKQYITEDHLLLFGKKLTLTIKEGHNRVLVTDEEFIVFAKDKTNVTALIENYLDKLLIEYIEHTRHKYDKILKNRNISLPEIKIRKMSSRWGTCIINKNIVHLSKHLIHYSHEAIDYVLLHEYIHFIEPNHSKEFYRLVSLYMPNYQEINEQLK